MYVKHYFNYPKGYYIMYLTNYILTHKNHFYVRKKKLQPKDFICLIAWLGYQMNLQLTVPHDNVEIIRQIHMMCFLLVHI